MQKPCRSKYDIYRHSRSILMFHSVLGEIKNRDRSLHTLCFLTIFQ